MRNLIMAISLAVLTGGCATDLVGDPAPLDHVESPAGLAIHPNGRYAYVVGSNFDLKYRATDGGAIYVVDLETNEVLPSSKRIGSFGTNIVLSSDARHGYTVTRDDDALVWFEISEDGSQIFCPKSDEDTNNLRECRVIVDDDPTYLTVTRSYRESQSTDNAGNITTKRVDFDLIMIAQLKNARVMAMTVREEDGELVFSKEAASFVYSASEITPIGGEKFVVTGRAATNLVVTSPAIDADGNVKGLYANSTVTVPNAYSAYLGRGMTLDPAGLSLFLINQYPDSLIQFDISGLMQNDNATDQARANRMMLLPVPLSKVVWVGSQDDGMLYLTSVSKDAIYIVDPRQMEILRVIETGEGPYEMVLRDDTLYVLNFLGNSIWSYDVSDPSDPVVLKKYLETDSMAEIAEILTTEAP